MSRSASIRLPRPESFSPKTNVVPFPVMAVGPEALGWFKQPITSLEQFRKLRFRVPPGLPGEIYLESGITAVSLPGPEILPAAQRGVIDAAEFVGPYQDRRMGLHNAAKFYYTTGWHETATVSELIVNKAAWDSLPPDLQAVIENACAACDIVSYAWAQRTNAEAMVDLVTNEGVTAQPLPDAVVQRLREATSDVLADAVANDPATKKVHESYMAFLKQYQDWASRSEAVYYERILPS